MSAVRHFINEAIRTNEIDEFLKKELDKAGYGGVEITRTPMGTRITVYAMRPGIVIGSRGTNIRELAQTLEERYQLTNPQIAVAEIEVPELNAQIMAARMANALQRGIYFRRTAYWTLNRIKEAGALGVEIRVSGKLRTQRHRNEKYRLGYIPQTGEPARQVRTAIVHVKMKPGIVGIKVKIVPPDAQFHDRSRAIPTAKKDILVPEEVASSEPIEVEEATLIEDEAEDVKA